MDIQADEYCIKDSEVAFHCSCLNRGVSYFKYQRRYVIYAISALLLPIMGAG